MCGPYREERAPETAKQQGERVARVAKTLARRLAERAKGPVRQHPQIARAHA